MEPIYCVNTDTITLKTLGESKIQDQEILNLNGSKATKIKTNEIIFILKSKAINFSDKSGGNMIFVKDCDELSLMQNAFLRELTRQYPQISFEKLPVIIPQNNLPENFNTYKFEKLSTNQITKQNGVFRAIFRSNDLQKTLFFKYDFKAKISALRATKNIKIKSVLSLGDYQIDAINFDDFSSDLMTTIPNVKLIAKRNVKSGEYLSSQFFIAQNLIRKGDTVVALLNDGELSVSIEARAMQHGNLGDTIKVITKDRRNFEATIISKNRVLIR
ncbi:MAG: flagellar basal body P-ring formation chaperone FlgA [Campylobacter sp.]